MKNTIKRFLKNISPSFQKQQKLLHRAYCYQQDKEYDKAIDLYQSLIDQGCVQAEHNLGYMYLSGQGVPKNTNEALKYFESAATKGNSGAQLNSAILYASGNEMDINLEKSYKWASLAAEQGVKEAEDLLWALKDYSQSLSKAGISSEA